MISEVFFATHFTSVWRGLAPTMEEFVRGNNLRGYDRFWTPIASKVGSARRGMVNEAAVILVSREIDSGQSGLGPSSTKVSDAFEAAHRYISGDPTLTKYDPPSTDEALEAGELYRRLQSVFGGANSARFRPNPSFAGCGVIASCAGDMIEDDGSIYEIKNGDRPFRSIDYRQLSVYLALKYASQRLIAPNLVLINARVGISMRMSSDDFTYGVAGLSPTNYCQSLIDSFSVALTSN